MDRLISEQAVIDAITEWLFDRHTIKSAEDVIKAIPSAYKGMTKEEREQAIEVLKEVKEDYWEDDGYGYATADCQRVLTTLDMAIEALAIQPAEPKIVPIAEIHFDKDKMREICAEVAENIEVKQDWIPVSKRLPKIADVYRVTRYYPNNVMNPNYLVDACFFDGSNTWYNDNRINHERAYVDNVIAWQENPEPYKIEPQESEEV